MGRVVTYRNRDGGHGEQFEDTEGHWRQDPDPPGDGDNSYESYTGIRYMGKR